MHNLQTNSLITSSQGLDAGTSQSALLLPGAKAPETVFVVDDDINTLLLVENALSGSYSVVTAPSALKMFELLKGLRPDIILLDIRMPGMDGMEALRRLKASPLFRDIPVIFLSGMSDMDDEILAFELGVVDFIKKPFSVSVLLKRIARHLNIDALIHERTAQLRKLKNGILSVLADLLEQRDEITGGHTERTAQYIQILIEALTAHDIYTPEIETWDSELVIASSRLHDVGKIVISDVILNKPGKLTPDEFETMKTHAAEGERIIEEMIAQTGEERFLHSAKLFAGYHHERWDGLGYPHGLKGCDIPLHGRIMALSDVYDAMLSDRPYKKAFNHETAVRFILKEKGRLFDPAIVRVFEAVHEKFRAISAGTGIVETK